MAAIDIVGHLIIPRHIHRRQFDDLPEHVKGRAYFENHGDTEHTGYYYNNQRNQKTPTEFLCVDGEDQWYILHYSSRQQRYQATDESVLPIQNPFCYDPDSQGPLFFSSLAPSILSPPTLTLTSPFSHCLPHLAYHL